MGKGKPRKFCWNTVGKKVPNCECLFVNREKGLFLSVYVDAINLENTDPMWKILMKGVDLGERHHSLTTFIWVALKENVLVEPL